MAKSMGKGRKQTERKASEPKPTAARTTALAPRERSTQPVPPSNPFALMRRVAEEMNHLFEDFGLGSPSLLPRFEFPWDTREGRQGEWLPRLEVTARGGNLIVRADLPGLTKNDVEVEVRDDVLTIEGERRHEREEKRKGFYRSERTYGRFYREVPLPEGVDPAQAKASFKNGVLEVTMPAPPRPAKGRQVPIEES
jgi:HSP20 family protein